MEKKCRGYKRKDQANIAEMKRLGKNYKKTKSRHTLQRCKKTTEGKNPEIKSKHYTTRKVQEYKDYTNIV